MRILFICRWNRFRSKIAEAYFNKINKNKKIKAEGAGAIAGFLPLDQYQVDIAKDLGIDLKGKTRGLSQKILDKADKIILVSNDVPISLFYPRYENKIVNWNICDVRFGDKKGAKKIILEITKKVDDLVKSLNNS